MVYFVDKSRKAIKLIRHNLEDLKGLESNYVIIKEDVIKFLKKFSKFKCDFIFLDPPYKIRSSVMKEIFEVLSEKRITDKETIIIYEFFFKKDINKEVGNLRVLKKSHFGDKMVIYLSPS